MVRVAIHLRVDQEENWRSIFEVLAPARREMGSLGGELMRNAEHPNDILILWKWIDLKSATEYFEMPAWRELMELHGVSRRPEVHYFDLCESIEV